VNINKLTLDDINYITNEMGEICNKNFIDSDNSVEILRNHNNLKNNNIIDLRIHKYSNTRINLEQIPTRSYIALKSTQYNPDPAQYDCYLYDLGILVTYSVSIDDQPELFFFKSLDKFIAISMNDIKQYTFYYFDPDEKLTPDEMQIFNEVQPYTKKSDHNQYYLISLLINELLHSIYLRQRGGKNNARALFQYNHPTKISLSRKLIKISMGKRHGSGNRWKHKNSKRARKIQKRKRRTTKKRIFHRK